MHQYAKPSSLIPLDEIPFRSSLNLARLADAPQTMKCPVVNKATRATDSKTDLLKTARERWVHPFQDKVTTQACSRCQLRDFANAMKCRLIYAPRPLHLEQPTFALPSQLPHGFRWSRGGTLGIPGLHLTTGGRGAAICARTVALTAKVPSDATRTAAAETPITRRTQGKQITSAQKLRCTVRNPSAHDSSSGDCSMNTQLQTLPDIAKSIWCYAQCSGRGAP